jgi:hypothetical protein
MTRAIKESNLWVIIGWLFWLLNWKWKHKRTDDDRLNKSSYLKVGFDYNAYENWLDMENPFIPFAFQYF